MPHRRHEYRGVVLLDAVRQEQAAIEVFDFAEQGAGFFAAVVRRFGEALEKQRFQEVLVVAIPALLLGLRQLVAEVVVVAAIKEVFLL